jgi:enoyl-CoA hydratase/carnithine racemase
VSDEGAVRFRRDGERAVITFDRPERRNALTWSMFDQLLGVLDTLHTDSSLRVAVLRGEGGHFVAGTEIGQFRAFHSVDDGIEYERRLEEIVSRLESAPLATIAAIRGAAVGGGLMLATACDVRVCTPDARFGAPIARTVGNALSITNIARLSAHFGPSRVKTVLFTANLIDAEEAHRAGFISEIIQPAAFDARVDALSDRIEAHAPITLRVTKESIRRIIAAGVPSDDDLLRQAYGSADFREGVEAFLEKRTPLWLGT